MLQTLRFPSQHAASEELMFYILQRDVLPLVKSMQMDSIQLTETYLAKVLHLAERLNFRTNEWRRVLTALHS